MSLSLEDIHRIAHLARIRLADEAEAIRTQTQLNGLFDLVAQMQAVDTTGIAPMSHARDVQQRLRADVVTEVDQRAALSAIAPQTQDGLYLVPRVIE
ncbi:MAG: Asp-tRNA(Asn)/Glu-tRNA(Gln) amidotransferase subunit GatC [Betaproteobacteria bacterium]|nr:MAG: Asp-tRNA(Asn)/Glu-tRNA(Gln) amidotransferase subunit GatC [Betaproteobacteria bacterium]